ncbi:MAG: hypothetical protein Q9199_004158 [Rusavskia elegans]
MLTEPLTAVFTAAIVALMLLLANVFQRDIALFFAKPIPGVPDQAFNQTNIQSSSAPDRLRLSVSIPCAPHEQRGHVTATSNDFDDIASGKPNEY